MRLEKLFLSTAAVMYAFPASAFAADNTIMVPSWLGFGMGGFALVVSAVLLVEVTALRRLADGSAFADNMAYVMAGIVALAASSLAGWIALLDPAGVSRELVRVVSDALVSVAVVLLGVYFYRVRRAMRRYLSVLSGGEPLAAVQAHESAEKELPGA